MVEIEIAFVFCVGRSWFENVFLNVSIVVPVANASTRWYETCWADESFNLDTSTKTIN
jgi:hypothetical protein